ncbi:hypothetical protein CY0110_18837 [Crocosphaera chwakensis CCY0110]|uniref:Uncharacterized protein n=1 Tax=Crocosphaera chwakensis CCY0110 TaxID=391612 RepID=A3IJ99_9CHRO|nr:hypothetical protein CY0110_18837 [Crocosphaera chwakensis CCY0110]
MWHNFRGHNPLLSWVIDRCIEPSSQTNLTTVKTR